MNNQNRAAEVIRTWQKRHKNAMDYNPDWAAHNLAIDLHNAGLITPDLPEPSVVMDENGKKQLCWHTPDCDIELEPGEMITTREAQAGHTIENGYLIGLALLAAAQHDFPRAWQADGQPPRTI